MNKYQNIDLFKNFAPGRKQIITNVDTGASKIKIAEIIIATSQEDDSHGERTLFSVERAVTERGII